MLRVHIRSLKPGIHQLALTPSREDLGLEDTFSNLEVALRLDYNGERVLVDFEVTADAQLTCDRTLQPFTQRISGSYALLYGPPDLLAGADEEYSTERVFRAADDAIDLTAPVRDTLVLALPARAIAPGAEALEMQMQFGEPEDVTEQVDPRWAALARLRPDADDAA